MSNPPQTIKLKYATVGHFVPNSILKHGNKRAFLFGGKPTEYFEHFFFRIAQHFYFLIFQKKLGKRQAERFAKALQRLDFWRIVALKKGDQRGQRNVRFLRELVICPLAVTLQFSDLA